MFMMQVDKSRLGQTWHVSSAASAGSTEAVVLLKANIHCFEPSEV